MGQLADFFKGALTSGKASFYNNKYSNDDRKHILRFHPYYQTREGGWNSFAKRIYREPHGPLYEPVDGHHRISHFFYEHRAFITCSGMCTREERHALHLSTASDLCSAHLRRDICLVIQQREGQEPPAKRNRVCSAAQ